MSQSLFPEFSPGRSYHGAFYPSGANELAYRTQMVNEAIIGDDWAKLAEAIERGWLTKECRAFDNSHVIDFCLTRGSKRCALELRALGWPEWQAAK